MVDLLDLLTNMTNAVYVAPAIVLKWMPFIENSHKVEIKNKFAQAINYIEKDLMKDFGPMQIIIMFCIFYFALFYTCKFLLNLRYLSISNIKKTVFRFALKLPGVGGIAEKESNKAIVPILKSFSKKRQGKTLKELPE